MLLERLIVRRVLLFVGRYQTVELRPGDLLKTQRRLCNLLLIWVNLTTGLTFEEDYRKHFGNRCHDFIAGERLSCVLDVHMAWRW
jgi:hypothetical protein